MLFKKPLAVNEFYIGYQAKAGPEHRKFARLVIFAVVVVMYFTISLIVSNQSGFSSGQYERNQFTELQGTLMIEPFAAIKTFYGKDIYGNPVVKTIPLVSYGKFGAVPILLAIQEKQKTDITNLWARLRGKLIYNSGAVVMELSEKDKSVLSILPITKQQQRDISLPVISDMDSVALTGQIIDPKCYFGVMKPAEGKPHSDCAIRCISGGIQPMLVIRESRGEEKYFILRDQDGDPINDKILCYIGMPVELRGELVKVDDWYILKVNPETGVREIK